MSESSLVLMILLVAACGTVGGAATRYERYGPPAQRGPAGALAVVSLILAVTVAVTVFGVATMQTDGMAWRLLGAACAGGVFGGLVAARGVDHYLVLGSVRGSLSALADDVRRTWRGLVATLRLVPWQSVATALSGRRAGSRDRAGRS